MDPLHPSSDNYFDLLDSLETFLKEAETMCPKEVPDPNTTITDDVIIELLRKMVQTVGFEDNDCWDYRLDEEHWWIVEFATGSLTKEGVLDCLQRNVHAEGGDILRGIRVWPEIMHFDHLSEMFEWGDIPLEFSIFGGYYFNMFDISQERLFDSRFGGDGVIGTAAVAVSSLIDKNSERVERWDTQKQALSGMREIPLMALLSWMHGAPGLEDNFYLAATEWNPEGMGIQLPWSEAYMIEKNRQVAQLVYKLTPNISKKDATWLFEQVLLAFNIQEPTEE